MLKLVESLAAKAERAKRTTAEFLPLHKALPITACGAASATSSEAHRIAFIPTVEFTVPLPLPSVL
jgi:hypothetical protein